MKILLEAAALPLIALGLAPALHAALHTAPVEYSDGDTKLEGYAVYDAAVKGKRPGVPIFHEWTGLVRFRRGPVPRRLCR